MEQLNLCPQHSRPLMPLLLCSLTIEGITEPIVIRYFETLNAGNFDDTSALFAADGTMRPRLNLALWDQKLSPPTYNKAQGIKLEPHGEWLKP